MRHALPISLLAALGACARSAPVPPPAPPAAPEVRADPDTTATEAPDSTDWRAFYEGAWIGVDSDSNHPELVPCSAYFVVQFERPQTVCVESNQIDVSARWALDEAAGAARLFLVGPEEVGAGGARLPWDRFDLDAPLATLEKDEGEGRFATLRWHGFRTRDGEAFPDYGRWREGPYAPAGAP